MTENDRIKINDISLEKAAGGTTQEAKEYIKKLEEKYGTTDRGKLSELATQEEKGKYVKWLFHVDGEPEPDPD